MLSVCLLNICICVSSLVFLIVYVCVCVWLMNKKKGVESNFVRYDRFKYRSRAQLQMIPADEPMMTTTINFDAVTNIFYDGFITYILLTLKCLHIHGHKYSMQIQNHHHFIGQYTLHSFSRMGMLFEMLIHFDSMLCCVFFSSSFHFAISLIWSLVEIRFSELHVLSSKISSLKWFACQ